MPNLARTAIAAVMALAMAGPSFAAESSANSGNSNVDGAVNAFAVSSATTHLLTVASIAPVSRLTIAVTPLDNDGLSSGTAPFARKYNHNTTVRLTAPLYGPKSYMFSKWLKDGADFANNSQCAVRCLMDADHQMAAMYAHPQNTSLLTVSSSNPDRGVFVSLYPQDKNNRGMGMTEFVCLYAPNTLVTVKAAPIAPNGWVFSKWLKDGADFENNTQRDVLCSMVGDHTMTAEFIHPYNTSLLTVASSNPNSGVFVSLYPSDKNNCSTGMTQFVAPYVPNSLVTVTAAPMAANGWVFSKWLRDGADFANNTQRDVLCSMLGDHTMTAVFAHPYNIALLTVASSNQAASPAVRDTAADLGAMVSIYPADKNQQTSCTTKYVCPFPPNSLVMLTANPTAPNGNRFWKWQRDGADFPNNTQSAALCSMGGDHTMTAIYEP